LYPYPCGIIRVPMSRPKSPGDLSEQELRRLLLDKRRLSRRDRLERFRRTGRVIALEPDAGPEGADRAGVGLPENEASADTTARGEGRRRWLDRLLLAVEVLAVIGFVAVLFSGLNVLRTLNAEVVQAIKLPTLTATPFITAVVLPSGHTPPTSPGGAQPNEAEIPEHLRPLVQSLANVPIPTAGVDQAVRIQIPALGLDAPVVQGDGWEQLKKGVAQHLGTANPGEDGNVVLSAHDDIFGELFRYLDKLKPGDQVILYTNQRQYVYDVTDTKIVEPTEVNVMAPTAKPVVTLISCYPYLVDKQRIVVRAKLQNP
jgi:sortase A